MAIRATDPFVRHWWVCAATLVANGVCAPDLTNIPDIVEKRKEVARYVGLLARELMIVAKNAPTMDVDLS